MTSIRKSFSSPTGKHDPEKHGFTHVSGDVYKNEPSTVQKHYRTGLPSTSHDYVALDTQFNQAIILNDMKV